MRQASTDGIEFAGSKNLGARAVGLLAVAFISLCTPATPYTALAQTGAETVAAPQPAADPLSAATPETALSAQTAKLVNAASGQDSPFSDLPRGDWAYNDIMTLVAASVIAGGEAKGMEKPAFRPDDILSRAECAGMVARLAVLSPCPSVAGEAENAVFADVVRDRPYFSDIEAAQAYFTDIVRLNGKAYFMPTAPARRGTLVTALMILAGGEAAASDLSALSGFQDGADIYGSWRPYAALAIERGVLSGYGDGTLRLGQAITRREACVLAVRALDGRIDFPGPKRTAVYMPNLDSGFYDAYFDDAVFVGDSITMEMMIHIRNRRKEGAYPLGNCRFCAQYVYGLSVAAGNFNPAARNVSYDGVAGPLEDVLRRMGAKDVYLMLGMNDFAGAGLPGSIEKYERIVDKVQEKNPEARIFIQFLTPVTKRREGRLLNNANTDKFNQAIVEMCERRGLNWIDISTPLKDEQNALVYEWSSDRFAHLNQSGYAAWFNALREFVCVKYLSGEWAPPASANTPQEYPGQYVYID